LILPIAVVADHNYVLLAVLVHNYTSACGQVVGLRSSIRVAWLIEIGSAIACTEKILSEPRRISFAETALTPNGDCADALVEYRCFES
jgi:hypothetical protein